MVAVTHDRLTRVGLIAAAVHLVALPLGHAAALRALSLAIALAAALVLWWRHDRKAWPPLLPVFAVWLAVALLSLSSTANLDASLRAIWAEILRSFLIFFSFHTLSRHLDALPAWTLATAANAFLLTGLALTTLAAPQHWGTGYLPALGDFATIAITVLPLLALQATTRNQPRAFRAMAAVAFGSMLLGAYLTYSRGFWLSLIVALLVVAVAYLSDNRQRRRVVFPVLLACTLAFAVVSKVAENRDKPLSQVNDRTPIYVAAIDKIIHNPPTGTGYGHETDGNWYQSVPGLVPGIYHPHNIVLSYLDQMGAAGLLVLALIFGVPLRIFLKARRRTSSSVAIAGLALLAAVFVKNSMDFFFCRSSLMLFFAHLGIYLGQLRREADQSQDQPMPPSSSPMRCS